MTIADPPARGTRPANRRDLIIAAASELFVARGYAAVNMGDIAESVAVGPSALYRHFPGKEQLLTAVANDVADRLARALQDASSDETLAVLARLSLDHRAFGVLIQREARHLPEPDRRTLRERLSSIQRTVAARLGRTELSTLAALSALFSPSYHRVGLPRPAYDELLIDLARRIIDVPCRSDDTDATRPKLLRTTKRELLLEQAVRLFSERTFASVSMEDLAAAVGLSASGVYTYFTSKIDLLTTALLRGNGYLQITLSEILASASDPVDALRRLVATYARFACAHPHYVDVLMTDIHPLPDDVSTELVQAQRDYVHEWVVLLRQARSDHTEESARVVTQAVIAVANDLGRRTRPRGGPALPAYLTLIGHSMLQV